MSVFEVKFADGSIETIEAICERDIWVECDSEENDIISVQEIGYKIGGIYV